MNNTIIIMMLLMLPLIITNRKKKRFKIMNQIKKRNGGSKMKEVLQRYVGEKCTIMTINESFGIAGTIKSIEENAVIMDMKKYERIINIDYIIDVTINKK